MATTTSLGTLTTSTTPTTSRVSTTSTTSRTSTTPTTSRVSTTSTTSRTSTASTASTASSASSATTTARTLLGPLTTTFAYPGSCTVNLQTCQWCHSYFTSLLSAETASSTTSTYITNAWQAAWQAQTCSSIAGNVYHDNTDCWPPRATNAAAAATSASLPLRGWGVYSPGLVCPSGYTTACSATGTTQGGFTFQFTQEASETAVGCCPIGYTCSYNPGSNAGQTCYTLASTGSYPVVSCQSGTSNGFSYFTVPTTITTSSSSVIMAYSISTAQLWAPLFQLLYQASDLADTTGSGSTAAASSAASSGGSGLSAGATAGIAVGVVVFVLALLGAAGYVWWAKRRQRHAAAAAAAAPVEVPGDTISKEMPGSTSGASPPPGTTSSFTSPVYEMTSEPSSTPTPQMQQTQRFELG